MVATQSQTVQSEATDAPDSDLRRFCAFVRLNDAVRDGNATGVKQAREELLSLGLDVRLAHKSAGCEVAG